MKFKKILLSSVIAAAIGFSIPYTNYATDSAYEKIKLFIDAFEIIKQNYVEEKESKDLIYSAIEGMVNSLDPFSQFMTPDVYKRVKSDTEGEFGGIGIKIDVEDGWPVVVTPLPGTPAFKAKLYPGDRIIKIEGESTHNMPLENIVSKLRGKPETKVKITVARKSKDKNKDYDIFDVELVRDIVKVETVNYDILEDKIGYIRLIDFSGHCYEDFKNALDALNKQGMEGLVLDLRYNPGGLLTASIDIAKLFIGDNKLIVYTKGRTKEDYNEFRAGDNALYPKLPVVVLVNRYSASASEILAGALQDNKRAIIIGENTFGKASVQTILPLADKSAIRLTIAKYYTPSGKMIQRDPKTGKGGITPDIKIELTQDDEMAIYEQMQKIYYPDEKAKKEKKEEEEKKKVKDIVLERAIEILKAREVFKNVL